MFVPLHVRSEHSLAIALPSVREWLARAVEEGWPALALTDVESLGGQVELHALARDYGVKAITGVELRRGFGGGQPGEQAGRAVLLARDQRGYQQLCRIVSGRRSVADTPTRDPLLDLDPLPQGLFLLSDDPFVIDAVLARGAAPDDVRFLLIRPGASGAGASRVPAVADVDAVLANAADEMLWRLRVAIGHGERVLDPGARAPARVMPARAEVEAAFADLPAALREGERIAEACELELTRDLVASSGEDPRARRDAAERLDREVHEAVERAADARWRSPAYRARLRAELSTFASAGACSYLSSVAEIAARARARGIPTAGRGSASSSLVAHVLGITPIDPIARGLYFERFLHPGRLELPDIDLDLPSERRDELLDWTLEHFSPRAAMISTHARFGPRSAYREALRALGMPAAELERFGRVIAQDELRGLPVRRALGVPERYRSWAPVIERLIDRLHHLSVHPGGVVIAPSAIDRLVSLERSQKGAMVTQCDKRSLEHLALPKVDLLGNRALSAISAATRHLGEPFEPADDDAATLHTLAQGRTIGCFQVETPALRATLKKLPMRSQDDLMAALAVVRPGAASGQAKTLFVQRARQEASWNPRSLEGEVWTSSYGVPLYDEDLIAMIARATGRSLAAADELRSELARGNDDQLAALHERFLAEARAHDVSPTSIARIWAQLRGFAAYSFNKAHAAGYAQLAFRCVAWKTHHPAAWAAAVLDHYGGGYPLRAVAADFVRDGVRLLPPSVQSSSLANRLEGDAVRIGLRAIKHVTQRTKQAILLARPFADLHDLLERVAPPALEREALQLSGACDELASDPSEQAALPERKRRLVRVRDELRFLDMHVSDHPLAILRDEATRVGCMPIAQLARFADERVRVAALVSAARRVDTPRGPMQFATLEDETATIEAVVFPGAFTQMAHPLLHPGPFLVEARVLLDYGEPVLGVLESRPFHERRTVR